jgi:hypothetical protein
VSASEKTESREETDGVQDSDERKMISEESASSENEEEIGETTESFRPSSESSSTETPRLESKEVAPPAPEFSAKEKEKSDGRPSLWRRVISRGGDY